jgi:hypothetical protein
MTARVVLGWVDPDELAAEAEEDGEAAEDDDEQQPEAGA